VAVDLDEELDAQEAAVDAAAERFEVWCREHGVDADPDWVATVLSLRVGYLDDTMERWTLGDLAELFTEIAPRKLSVPGEEIRGAMDALTVYLRYLDHEEALAGGSDGVDRLTAWLETSQDAVVAAMDDRSRWGPAKALFGAAMDDGVDTDDLDAVRAWMDGFNDRPFEERDALLSGTGPASHLPPQLLPSEAELIELAEATPLWRRVTGFVTYVGEKLPLTDAGNIKLADARRLVTQLGTGDVMDPNHYGRHVATRSSTQLIGLTRAVDLARELGLVEQRGRQLYRVSDRVAAMDRDPLGTWQQLVTALLQQGVLGYTARFRTTWWVEELDGGVLDLLVALDEVDGALPIDGLVDAFLAGVAIEDVETYLVEWMGRDIHRYLAQLEVVGLVRCSGVRTVADGLFSHDIGGEVEATPLSTWFLHRVAGRPVHQVGERAESDATELLTGLGDLPVDVAEAEVDAWLAARQPAAALAEVAEAAGGDRLAAMTAFLVFDRVPPDVALPAVEALEGDPVAGPFARAWLVQQGARPIGDAADDGLDAMIGVLATLAQLDGPQAVSDAIGQLGEPAEQIAFIEAAWRCEAPETLDVLTAVGDLHPDKAVRKAGRKAAFKRRSAT